MRRRLTGAVSLAAAALVGVVLLGGCSSAGSGGDPGDGSTTTQPRRGDAGVRAIAGPAPSVADRGQPVPEAGGSAATSGTCAITGASSAGRSMAARAMDSPSAVVLPPGAGTVGRRGPAPGRGSGRGSWDRIASGRPRTSSGTAPP